MKRILLVLLILCVISCCACENNKEANNIQPESNPSSTSSTEISSNTDNNYTNSNEVISSSKPIVSSNHTVSSEPSGSSNPTASSKPTTSSKPTVSNSTSHTHKFSTATCTQASTCSCGANSGSALGHSWNSATCTNPKKCSRCGTTSGSPLEHSWNSATCTSPKKCSNCGTTSGSVLGHNYSGEKCATCGETNPNYTKIYSLGETWTVDGNWEFKVNSVKTHYLCNSYTNSREGYTNEQVVYIDFTYKNIGYTRSNGLLHFALFNTYDETGEGAESYACTHENPRKQCPIGTSSKSQLSYVLNNDSTEITFMVQQLTNNATMEKAIFKLPISQ